MHVAGLQTEPVHRRQRAHGIAAMAVPHQLGLGGGARGEIEQERIVGVGRTVRRELGRPFVGIAERLPAVDRRRTRRDERDAVARQAGALGDLVLVGHDHARTAALDAVGQLLAGEQRRRRDHDDAQLHGRQHDLPQRRHVVEDEQEMVAAPEPLLAQIVGDLVRARGQLGKGEFRLPARRHIDDPERAAILAVGGVRQLGIEPVERPVERHGIGPLEPGHGLVVGGPVGEQELAGLSESRHGLRPRWFVAPCARGTGEPSRTERRILRGLGIVVEAQAAGIETVARRFFGRRDEQRRHLEVADTEARLAQPARGADRGAALVEPQPAAHDRSLAGIVDADIGCVVALEGAGGAVDPPFERHGAIELGVVGRDVDRPDIVVRASARIAQPAHVRRERRTPAGRRPAAGSPNAEPRSCWLPSTQWGGGPKGRRGHARCVRPMTPPPAARAPPHEVGEGQKV